SLGGGFLFFENTVGSASDHAPQGSCSSAGQGTGSNTVTSFLLDGQTRAEATELRCPASAVRVAVFPKSVARTRNLAASERVFEAWTQLPTVARGRSGLDSSPKQPSMILSASRSARWHGTTTNLLRIAGYRGGGAAVACDRLE